MSLSPLLEPVSFRDVAGWASDRHGHALSAFRRSALHALETSYKSGSLGVEASGFVPAFEQALASDPDDDAARAFFEEHFLPHRLRPDDRPRGFVTGFYEPVAKASPERTARFAVPLLAPPADLVKVD